MKGRKPKWITYQEDNLILSNNRRLNNSDNITHINNPSIFQKQMNFVLVTYFQDNILGKIIEIQPPSDGIPITYLEH